MNSSFQSQDKKNGEASGPTVITSRQPFASVGGEKASGGGLLENVRISGGFLDAGQDCDGYRLVYYVGGGGMGHVWLAEDMRLNRSVALKVLDMNQNLQEDIIMRFRGEAQVMALLNHPNIAQIYVFGENPALRIQYIAMEYVDGENVRDRINQRGPLPVTEAVSFALQIAHALGHLERNHVVHRDIKPSNIIVTREKHAKLIDMGLARQFEPGATFLPPEEEENLSPQLQAQKRDLTASGVTLGTFDFISPEQAREPRGVDIRSDIYSLGCTMFYMLTGNPPFAQGGPLQKLLQHQGDAAPDVRRYRPDVPESFQLLIEKAMRKDRMERFQTTEELIAALEKVAEQTGFALPGIMGVYSVAERMPVEKPELPAILDWNVVKGHLTWLVPVVVLGLAVLVLNWLWTPDEAELELPRAPAAAEPLGGPDREETPMETRRVDGPESGPVPVPVPISPTKTVPP